MSSTHSEIASCHCQTEPLRRRTLKSSSTHWRCKPVGSVFVNPLFLSNEIPQPLHVYITNDSPSRYPGPGPPGHKGPYSKSMTCQSRWRTELETSQWIVLFQKWKSCYLRNVTGFIVLQAAIETESLTSPIPSLRHRAFHRRPAAGFGTTGKLYLV